VLANILAYVAALVVMLALDLLWLGVAAKKMYVSALGSLMKDAPNLPAAGAFYLLYVLGILYFATTPALAAGSWGLAAWRGALFGFFAYMTYELTNLALIRGWPASLVVVDIVWGVVLTAIAATAGYWAGKLAA
jgi:uncharacterized membrane protein